MEPRSIPIDHVLQLIDALPRQRLRGDTLAQPRNVESGCNHSYLDVRIQHSVSCVSTGNPGLFGHLGLLDQVLKLGLVDGLMHVT